LRAAIWFSPPRYRPGTARRVTPEATLSVAHKEMPGFGEQMRISLAFVPILSRQVAVVRARR
jgi:molybdopterin adenylyltransferase